MSARSRTQRRGASRPVKAPAAAEAAARRTAEQLAEQLRPISVSEFFAKNRHLLGFDNPTRALLTAVKEAVDNALDACEEAGILPMVSVRIEQKAEDRFRVVVTDNGPGIVKEQIGAIFGKLLYGSKFHRLKMSRGQQGIGISAAVLYSQLTTGKPTLIVSRTGADRPAHAFLVSIDTTRNEPLAQNHREASFEGDHGTTVDLELEARYGRGDRSVDEYLRLTALANPHVTLRYQPPQGDPVVYERVVDRLPPEPRQIQPHPYGVELGTLIKILQSTPARTVKSALETEFCRISARLAAEICARAGISPKVRPSRVAREEAERLYPALQSTKIMAPPTDCIVPIGAAEMERALRSCYPEAEFVTAVSRPPAVYRGHPFLMEAGIAFGLPDRGAEDLAEVVRLANRVPLLYQPGACAITKAVVGTDWRNYGLSQSKGAPPAAPIVVMVHIASVWVPFTSEAKEAVAHYPEILREIRLALQECGRRLLAHLNQRRRAEYEQKRRSIFERYIEEVATALHHLTRTKREAIRRRLHEIARKVTRAGEL